MRETLIGFLVFCGGSIALLLLLHFGAKAAERRGWIVKRAEPRQPPPEFIKLYDACRELFLIEINALRMPQFVRWLDEKLFR